MIAYELTTQKAHKPAMSGIKRYFNAIPKPVAIEDNRESTPTKKFKPKLNSEQHHKDKRSIDHEPGEIAITETEVDKPLAKSPVIKEPVLEENLTKEPGVTEHVAKESILKERQNKESHNRQFNRDTVSKDAESSTKSEIQHLHQTYKFLYSPDRRDFDKRKPDHPDYDEKTLYVPPSFLDSQTPALRQWWLIKQKNMDAVLFFKMGKFYELFNEDAVIGVNVLDLTYMKGDETRPAHSGFPEISYEKYSKILIDRGYRVIRIEQTETPAMMEDRCRETGRKGKFDKVVQREVCRITTKGTQMLGTMESIFHSSQNQYLLAVHQCSNTELIDTRTSTFGVSFVDVTIGRVYIGQFHDDRNLSRLNILLAHYVPTEILYERGNLNNETYQALLRTGALLTSLKPKKEFWTVKQAMSELKTGNIFIGEGGKFEWPAFLKDLFEDCEESPGNLLLCEPKSCHDQALHSFSALVYYLKSHLILDQVLSCATFETYRTPLDRGDVERPKELNGREIHYIPPMILDHVALKNLEVFQNSRGGEDSTLFSSINFCKTHFGQRLLKVWLCSPLCDPKQIENRLDAVEALISNENASMMNEIAHTLSQTPDLERLLSKVKSQCFKSGSDCRAILFDSDQYSKAKITSFINLIQSFRRLRKFISSVSSRAVKSKSGVLRRLLTFTTEDGLFPDYSKTLEYFETAFNHDLARSTGKIIPASGVDTKYDRAQENIDNLKKELDDYLQEQKRALKCGQLEYFGSAKNRYQIQVPEAYCKRVPADYRIETTRKGFKRYYTPTIEKLFQKLMIYEEEMKRTLDGIMSTIFEQFSRKFKLWSSAIECIATLDVLQSIATYVRSLKAQDIDLCRPEFIDIKEKPSISYENGRHPALVKLNSDYIPNDLLLDNRTILLSGANMGGKSTLMRQTATMVILAQIGSFVPASKFIMSPVDRIFSRLGASDRLIEGDSTFYTELVETSAMLQCATGKSLLLLDELGRGTSTFDGTAIAFATLREISENIRCRCLFSTHYHTLVRDFETSDKVRLAHMACKIEKESESELDSDPLKENITFLYKIAEGPVGRSYGFNVARLAGITDSIIREAYRKSKELETRSRMLEKLQALCSTGKLSNDDKLTLRGQLLENFAN